MTEWFSVDKIAITVLEYPISYVELFGTILYLASVWLISRRNILTWPVGIISVLLYLTLFYQIRLYSDVLEQIYYLGASVYGWWIWREARQAQQEDQSIAVHYSTSRSIGIAVVVTLIAGIVLGQVMSRIHEWLPDLFPQAAAYPHIDALTTMMSFMAMWLMARKRTESWIYWIIVDMIAIWLYYVQEVRFISLLYVVLLGMAIYGFWTWHTSKPAENAT